jgi:hypothetical protein
MGNLPSRWRGCLHGFFCDPRLPRSARALVAAFRGAAIRELDEPMTINGNGEHQVHARRASENFDGAVGIEIIPDGASLIVLAYIGTRKFELVLSREEVRALAKFLDESASR